MLQKLVIRNYAIIDHLIFEPGKNFNTLTGETGAGKSIILGALSLILGERADTSVLINKTEKCVVEALFDVRNFQSFRAILRENDLDDEEQCIIRREISTGGKSRAFVNDTPVTLHLLNSLTSLLVDLHQQFGHLALENDRFQMDVIDAIAGNEKLLLEFQEHYREWQRCSQQLQELQHRQEEWQKEADYKQFLYDELAAAAFAEHEIEEAEAAQQKLMHSERILSVLESSVAQLEEGEQPMLVLLKKTLQQLQGIADVVPETQPLALRVSGAYEELKDVAAELGMLRSNIDLDPAGLLKLQDRLDLAYRLLKKHALKTTAELLTLQQSLGQELQATQNLSMDIETLRVKKNEVFEQARALAVELSKRRHAVASTFSDRVNERLQWVGMPNSRFAVELSEVKTLQATGQDNVHFLLDANKTGQMLPVYKVASGGELSRIMLCIKSLTAEAMQLPTLIFDEVDTGISGEAARQVGLLLQSLGKHHQIISITHQPQVAAKGSTHFFVYKDITPEGKITTRVKQLNDEERIKAVAQMIGGEAPSEAAFQSARELVA